MKLEFLHHQYITKSFKLFLFAIVISGSIFLVTHGRFSEYFPIHTVQVYGIQRSDKQELQQAISPFVQRGFFTVDVDAVKDRLLQVAWVSDVFVRRIWPAKVAITIIEKNPIAKWNETSLLSTTGELFNPLPTSFPDLPHFVGPEGKQLEMLQYYDEINRIVQPLHAKISSIELTPYFSWKIVLNNGIALRTNHKDILTRVSQFVKVYPKIVGERATEVDYVDLRYPYGVAVRWKPAVKI